MRKQTLGVGAGPTETTHLVLALVWANIGQHWGNGVRICPQDGVGTLAQDKRWILFIRHSISRSSASRVSSLKCAVWISNSDSNVYDNPGYRPSYLTRALYSTT
jgi:hypothetical protein